MIEESRFCTNDMKKKKCFDKGIVMTKEDDEDFEYSSKCCICDDVYVDGDVKVILSYQSKI